MYGEVTLSAPGAAPKTWRGSAGRTLTAVSNAGVYYPAASGDIDAGLCSPGKLDDSEAKGKVVICRRGVVDIVAKASEVARAGGVGMVLINTATSYSNLARQVGVGEAWAFAAAWVWCRWGTRFSSTRPPATPTSPARWDMARGGLAHAPCRCIVQVTVTEAATSPAAAAAAPRGGPRPWPPPTRALPRRLAPPHRPRPPPPRLPPFQMWDVPTIHLLAADGAELVAAVNASAPGGCTISLSGQMQDKASPNEAPTVGAFSSRGPSVTDGYSQLKPDILSPGVDIFAAVPGGRGAYWDGTSMATPGVTGIAALVRSKHPE